MLLVSTNIFSQKVIGEVERKKLEEKAINKMRKTFNISQNKQLWATTIFEIIDNTQIFAEKPTFDINNKIENYLQNSKVIHYEIFVYDSELKNVYVVNRIFLGNGKFLKKLYLGNKEDYIISKLMFEKKYDFAYKVSDINLNYNVVFLGLKNGLIDLIYLQNENSNSWSNS